jgi:A/G-specific adenine glycosylase
VAWWIERKGAIWLVRRPAKGMLGGMAALPGSDWSEVDERSPEALVHVHHVFTHFRLDLAIVSRNEAMAEGWWQPLDRLQEAGLPTLYRRAVESVLENRTKLAA